MISERHLSIIEDDLFPKSFAIRVDLCISVRIDKSRRRKTGTSNIVSLTCHENIFPYTSSDLELCNSFKKLGDIDNFPLITDRHKSLACKAMKANPELYTKYANVKTPVGFTFDQAIQVIHNGQLKNRNDICL
jgi:hypothetical protein